MQVIGDIPRLNAKRYPNKKAVIMGEDSLTFDQLNRQANQLANGLLSLGIAAGDRIAILSFNRLEYVVINYAVAKVGGVLVPANFRYKKDELIYVVNNSNPRVLFYGPEFSSLVDEARGQFVSPTYLVSISGESLQPGTGLKRLMDGQSTSNPLVIVDPASPSCIMYTSGTTGFPKGALYSHASYLAVYAGMTIEGNLTHDDTMMVSLPLFHNGGLNAQLQPTLMLGGTGLIMPKGFDPDKILDAVSRYGATVTMWVPTMLAMLVNHPNITKYPLPTLKKIWYGSSAISPPVLEASIDLFRAHLYQWYGQVETGMVSVLRPEDHSERSQCTGREMVNADLRIVDEEGKDTPVGEVGEIISAQKPLGMIGYYKMDEANEKTIRNGWIHTGDLARVEGSGYFTIVDRIKDMIISGAENIYPKEIEDLISAHPGVREVAVFGIPDDIYGESVCAAIVKRDGYQLDQDEVIRFCATQMSGYKKPKKVVFVDELPKNAAGKVTKNALREPFWAGRKKRV